MLRTDVRVLSRAFLPCLSVPNSELGGSRAVGSVRGRLLVVLSAIAAVAYLAPTALATPPAYRIVDLGGLGGTNFSNVAVGTAINSSDMVTGYAYAPVNVSRAFIWTPASGIRDLGETPSGTVSDAWGINDQGTIVGKYWTGSAWHAYSYNGTTLTDLASISGLPLLVAMAINGSGHVAIETGADKAYYYDGASFQNIPGFPDPPPARTKCGAMALNASNTVVGRCGDAAATSNPLAYMWSGSIAQLSNANSTAWGINSTGSVAGWSGNDATVWGAVGGIDLGRLPGDTVSTAYGINDAGQVVGASGTQSDPGSQSGSQPYLGSRGFVFSGGAMYDLNTVVPPNSGYVITAGTAINSQGDIVASAVKNNQQRAVLLQATATVPDVQTWGEAMAVNPTNKWAEPVDSATGVYSTQSTDLSLPSIGIPFRFTRYYVSARSAAGRLGPGWSDSLSTSLTPLTNGIVTLNGEDGQQVAYTRQADGSFVGAPGSRATLATTPSGFELITQNQLHYEFDATGRLTALLDRNNEGLHLMYDGSGQLSSATTSGGESATFTYASGLLIRVTLPDGRSVAYGYSVGVLTTVTDSRGGLTTYGYDGGGRLASIVDQNNHTVVQNTYGSDGRVTDQFDARGDHSTFGWNPTTQTATLTNARGKTWTDAYFNNVLQTSTDPLGHVTTYYYDQNLDLAQVTDARGNVTTMTFDAIGNMLSRTAPPTVSYKEVWTYNARNDPTTYTDGRGNQTSYGYDTAGNLTSITRPGNIVTQFGRDASTGQINSSTDPRSKTTTFQHDVDGNVTATTTPLGSTTTMGYDTGGRMTTRVEPRGHAAGANPLDYTWTYTYNAANQLLTQLDPLGNLTQLAYDPVGNKASITDANNHVTQFAYNAMNELASVTGPDQMSTNYGYDSAGNLITRQDANTHTTTYGYDDANRIASVASPTGQLWTYQYDANANLTQIVDANGNATSTAGDGTTTLAYDVLNRIAQISYSDGSTPGAQFAYDANGNRTSMTDGAGAQTYTYDLLNRLTAVTRGARSFNYVYDPADDLTQETYPDSTVANFTYDNDRRLASLTSAGATTAYNYDPAGNLISAVLPASNGYTESRTFDRAGRLTAVSSTKGTTTLSSFNYVLDPVGNPVTLTGTGGTTTFKYDLLDRTTEACYQSSPCSSSSSPFIRDTYDAVGNRLTDGRPTGTTTYAYNGADQLTSQTGPNGIINYTYNNNGDMTAAGTTTYIYDLADRITSATVGHGATTYSYDGDGNRMRASTGSSASSNTNYLWDTAGPMAELALEQDGSNALLRRYLYGADLTSMTNSTGTFYYHHDGLDSVANVSSSTGATQWTYSYEPYGAVRSSTSASKAPTNLLRWEGQLADANTNTYYLRARQYDPAMGRFLRPDPVGAAPAEPYVASYLYAKDRPNVLVDPEGLASIGLCVGGAISFLNVALHANVCAVSTSSGEFGFTATGGGGLTTIGTPIEVSGTVGLQVSNADCIGDLGKRFDNVGGSAEIGGGVAANGFSGRGHAGQRVVGSDLGVGVGLGLEAHTGPSYTVTKTILGGGCKAQTGSNTK